MHLCYSNIDLGQIPVNIFVDLSEAFDAIHYYSLVYYKIRQETKAAYSQNTIQY